MHLAADLLFVVTLAAITAGAAARVGLSAPLVLTVVGIVLSFVPGVPHIPLEPEVVLLGILPPLLYATALRTPWVDIRRQRRKIGLLSVGLVVATAFVVAGVVRLIVPEIDFAVALALGAVVAPPDAVAATAVARRVSMPRPIISLLEGESLLNDATALALLRTATVTVGALSLVGGLTNFGVAVLGGLVVGWAVAMAASLLRRSIEDPVLDTTISLVVPFVAYLGAETVHGSGVVAVVLAGVMLGHRSPEIQSAASRVTERVIWRTVQFVLESTVFLLIGLQLQALVAQANADAMANSTIALLGGAVLVTAIAVRMVWVFPAAWLPRLLPAVRAAEPAPSWRHLTLLGWAGMRGVVTVAAVLTIPPETAGYAAIVVAAFTVVVGTLLIQGTTLPWVVRALGVRGPDPVQDALQHALVQQRAVRAGLDRLEQERRATDPQDVVDGLRSWGGRVANAAWERVGANGAGRETPAAAFQRLRTSMLDAERRVAVAIRRDGAVASDIVEEIVARIDEEDAMLARFAVGREQAAVELHPPKAEPAACEHLAVAVRPVAPDAAPDACPDCLAIDDRAWVHLRMCLTCGHVGCCDSSPNRHAYLHFQRTGHPVMRSIELGESWRWCWVDAELG